MTGIDWSIVAVLFVAFFWLVIRVSRLNKSVADFLAANRTAGRYLLTVSQSAAAFGAVSAVAIFQLHYSAGFPPLFWTLMLLPINFGIMATGWVIYRYRETRVYTLAQFFELRYSHRFRIFMGALCFVSGILNYGIFPAVTANFFIYFCALPQYFLLFGFSFSTFVVLMAAQLGIAVVLTQSGGQLTVLIADFVQGQFINVMLLVTIVWLGFIVSWDQVITTFSVAPEGQSLVNPFQTSAVADFNFWFYAIAAIGLIYNTMAWQGSQGFNACARTPHEARMGGILGLWRNSLTSFLLPIAAICGFVILHHPDFLSTAVTVTDQLATISDPQVREQMTVPLALRFTLPVGLMGLFTAMMISATLSTDSSYLHSWGTIFIQDVVMPVLKKPLSPPMHMRALRLAVLGVAVFAFFFSLLFRQTEYILLFFAATGAIFLGGAGSVIIGGLYWKKGTTAAAWAAMIAGSTISTGGIIAQQLDPDFPINGQQIFFCSIVSAVGLYAVISWIQNIDFNLDRILHRKEYRELLPPEERANTLPVTGVKALGPGPDFTPSDRFVLWLTMIVQAALFFSTVVISILYFIFHFGDPVWFTIWFVFIVAFLIKAVISVVWLLIGGIGDFRTTLMLLRTSQRNRLDDGVVLDGHNRGEAAFPPSGES